MSNKYTYIKEYLKWKDEMLGIEMGNLAKTEDDYYRMILVDLEYLNADGSEMKMNVVFSEINNPRFKGEGIIRYKHSEIHGFEEIIPVKLDGILYDIFEEDPGIIYDFVRKIYDQIKY